MLGPKRPALTACAIAILITVAACDRAPPDADRSEVRPSPIARIREALRRDGEVTVSGDDTIATTLTWTAPELTLAPAEAAGARRRAAVALTRGRLYEDADAAIPLYLALLELDPEDAVASRGLERAFDALLAAGRDDLIEAGNADMGDEVQAAAALAHAHRIAAVARSIGAGRYNAQVLAYLGEVDRADRVHELNLRAEAELDAGRLGVDDAPADDRDTDGRSGAWPVFRQVLAQAPDNARARQGVAAIESTLIREAEQAADAGDFTRAGGRLQLASTLRPGSATLQDARERIEAIRIARILRLRDEGLALLRQPDQPNHLKRARSRLADILLIAAPGDPAAAELRQRIDLATHYGKSHPGLRFSEPLREGGRGPEMIVVPHGGFRMGARFDDAEAVDAERPLRYVRFDRGFAMSRTEVTVADFRKFVLASGHRTHAVRRGHSLVYDDRAGNFVRQSGVDWHHDHQGRLARDDMPVLHVSARDAEAYARWLSLQTGHRYRLPSEAEFEYVLRAGTDGRYPWGDGPPLDDTGNLTGGGDRSPGGRTWGNAFVGYRDGVWGPSPVGRFRANAFSVHDLEGNVSEWVADCWHDGFRRAPVHGEAWINPGCRTRVVRGGAWSNAPTQVRASWRSQAESDVTDARTGFRVVREL